jgi:hypothetical protein
MQTKLKEGTFAQNKTKTSSVLLFLSRAALIIVKYEKIKEAFITYVCKQNKTKQNRIKISFLFLWRES